MPDIFSTEPKQPKQEAPQLVHPDHDAIQSVKKLIHSHHQPMGIFATYTRHPTGVNFTNQEPDEIILLFLRRHFITNIPWIVVTSLLFFVPPVLLLFLSAMDGIIIPAGLTIVLTIFYYLLIISYAFSKFISWFYNIGIVTQKRLVDLDSTNILSHNTATANFNELVDVKFTQKGFFQSTFDYGDIHLQTEALRANFEFDACPKPSEVTDVISDLRIATKDLPYGNS